MILELITIIAPAFLAALCFSRLRKTTVKPFSFLVSAAIFAFLINCFVLSIAYLGGHSLKTVGSLYENIGAALKYCGLSLIAAIAFPGILSFAADLLKHITTKPKGKSNDAQDR